MIKSCEYCKYIFEYKKTNPRSNRRFCDKCIILRKKMYPFRGAYVKKHKILDKIKEESCKERESMKKIFAYDEVSIYV